MRCEKKHGAASVEAAYLLHGGCPCVDHVTVDMGTGVQTGQHSYYCAEHGEFGIQWEDPHAWSARVVQVFRDDEYDKEEESANR